MRLVRTLKVVVVLLAAASLAASSASASSYKLWEKRAMLISKGYSKPANVPLKHHSKYYKWHRQRDAKSWGHYKSFSAAVDVGKRYTGGNTCEVAYDRKTGILTVRGYDFTTNHNMAVMEYDRKKGTITVYGSRGARDIYYHNGKLVHYNARTGETSREKISKREYEAMKKKVAEYIRNGIKMIEEGGKITEGSKENFNDALDIVNKGK